MSLISTQAPPHTPTTPGYFCLEVRLSAAGRKRLQDEAVEEFEQRGPEPELRLRSDKRVCVVSGSKPRGQPNPEGMALVYVKDLDSSCVEPNFRRIAPSRTHMKQRLWILLVDKEDPRCSKEVNRTGV